MIDTALLPVRCLIDTGVLIRALRQKSDAKSAACREFWDAMLKEKRRVLVAAPTWAEVLRGEPASRIPSTPSVEVVPFDRRAAEVLGSSLPIATLKANATETGLGLAYIKYDAMIVACAQRWKAECIVSIDSDIAKLAPRVGLRRRMPEDFVLPILRGLVPVPAEEEE